MKKIIDIVRYGDKTGLKLTAICSLNWLMKQFVKGQYLFFMAVVLAQFVRPGMTETGMVILASLLPIVLFLSFFRMLFRRRFDNLERIVLFLLFYVMVVTEPVTEMELVGWVKMFLLSLMFYFMMRWLQPKLFEKYLFKNVIDKKYLGVRKLKDDLPPAENLYEDANEVDAEKRMAMLNSRAVKLPYQKNVELSYLNSERQTGKRMYRYSYDSDKEPFREEFADIDTIYRPYFTVYPFGKEIDFHFKLIRFELSRNAAFTKVGTAYLVSKK